MWKAVIGQSLPRVRNWDPHDTSLLTLVGQWVNGSGQRVGSGCHVSPPEWIYVASDVAMRCLTKTPQIIPDMKYIRLFIDTETSYGHFDYFISLDSSEDSTDTTVIPIETPIIALIIPPSPDYTLVSPDYSPTSEAESDPSEDPSSGHIPPLPAVSTFLSSDDDTIDSDTPDTPPSPSHDTPFTEITASIPRLPVIPHHSSLDLSSTYAGPSRKRRRSPMTYVPALPPVSKALSPVRADLIPSPKRVRDIEDISKPAQDGAAEVTYETLGDLVQRFHDHTQAIPVHCIQVIKGVQREQGHRIIGVKLAVTALTERVAELERDNKRLRGENGGYGGNGNRDNGGNENGGNRGNGNGGNRGNRNHA
nr:hypothetical protein [Tanacetum cinerariifolium]